jgi:general secretion pathway protein I
MVMVYRLSPSPKASGFTLLELLIAFVIFALAAGILMQLVAGSLRNARQSSLYTQAALYAQSKLDEIGMGESLKEGSDTGRFDDQFEWVMAVQKQEAPPSQTGAIEAVPIDLYRIDLTVRWRDNPQGKIKESSYATLRASLPEGANP